MHAECVLHGLGAALNLTVIAHPTPAETCRGYAKHHHACMHRLGTKASNMLLCADVGTWGHLGDDSLIQHMCLQSWRVVRALMYAQQWSGVYILRGSAPLCWVVSKCWHCNSFARLSWLYHPSPHFQHGCSNEAYPTGIVQEHSRVKSLADGSSRMMIDCCTALPHAHKGPYITYLQAAMSMSCAFVILRQQLYP